MCVVNTTEGNSKHLQINSSPGLMRDSIYLSDLASPVAYIENLKARVIDYESYETLLNAF